MRYKQAISCSILLWLSVLICSLSGISQTQQSKLDKEKFDNPEASQIEGDSQSIQQYYEGKILKGNIVLSDKLPKISKKYLPGKRYPENPIEGVKRTETWYRIPTWVAGDWESVDENGKPTQQQLSFKKGTILDAEGSVWHLSTVPHCGVVKDIDYNIWRIADYSDQLIDSQDHVQARTHYIASGVDDNGNITRTFQEEVLATYQPKGNGLLEVTHTGKLFDINGNYLRDINSRAVYSRIKTFPFKAKPDKSIEKKFKNYLKSNGLEKLIPASLK